MGQSIDLGNVAAWAGFVLSLTIAVVGAVIALRRRAHSRKYDQADAITCWIEEGGEAGPVVVVRNASGHPVRDLMIAVTRSGKPVERTYDVDSEMLTEPVVGPQRVMRYPITLSALGGSVRAEASLFFRDQNEHAWVRDTRGVLHKYAKVEFSTFDSGIRSIHDTTAVESILHISGAIDPNLVSDVRPGSYSRRQFRGGTGNQMIIRLLPEGVAVDSFVSAQVTLGEKPKLTIEATDGWKIVELTAHNVPSSRDARGNPIPIQMDMFRIKHWEDSLFLSFAGKDMETIMREMKSAIPIPKFGPHATVGEVLYREDESVLAIRLANGGKVLHPDFLGNGWRDE